MDRFAALLFFAATVGACAHQPADPASVASAALERTPVFDGHNDLAVHFAYGEPPWSLEKVDLERLPGQSSLAKLRSGHIGGALITTGSALAPEAATHFEALKRSFDWFDSLVVRHQGAVAKVTSLAELRESRQRRKIALIMAIEGGEQIDASIPNLGAAYARGVRSLGIIYNDHNAIGDGGMPSNFASRPAAGGLTPFGLEVIAEMNRLGMIIDLSHAADDSAQQAMRASRAPVIFSHSGARALTSSPRNLSDETLRLAHRRDALVMVPLVPYLVSDAHWRWWSQGEANFARLEKLYPNDRARVIAESRRWDAEHPQPAVAVGDVADHVEHIARLVGFENVGIGSDFDGMGSHVIPALADASRVPALFEELARRGWSQAQLEALASRNFERLLGSVERAAAR